MNLVIKKVLTAREPHADPHPHSAPTSQRRSRGSASCAGKSCTTESSDPVGHRHRVGSFFLSSVRTHHITICKAVSTIISSRELAVESAAHLGPASLCSCKPKAARPALSC